MDGINKFNVPLDPEEVRKIQAGRKPQTEAPKKNITEEVSAMIDEIGKKHKRIPRGNNNWG